MKEIFIFFATFFLFPIENPIPSFFYFSFILLFFLKSKRNIFFFFLSALICKSSIISYIPQKNFDKFEGKVISFPYEGQYGISLIVKWKGYGIAPINIQNYEGKLPPLGSNIEVVGERILFERAPKPFSNKYNFYIKIKNISQIEVKKTSIFNKIIYFPSNLNQILYEKTKNIFSSYSNFKHFSNSLIFAHFSQEDDDFFETFQMAGIVHILSISGLHIGIYALYFLIFLRLLKVPPKLIYIITILFLLFFSSFCGFRAPVLRASLMLSLYFFFLLIHKPMSFENTLYLSLPLNGLLMPNQILTPGFFLSYLSTYILIKTAPLFKDKLKSILFSSIYVQLFIQPFLIYSFGMLNWQAVILNPLLLPFLSVFLLFSPILIFFPFHFLLKIFDGFSFLFFEAIQGTKNFLWWGAFLPFIPKIFVIFYYCVSIYSIEKRKENIGKILFFLLIFILFLSFLNFKEKNEVVFLNVGQGLSILVKDNFENILIDTGKRSYFGWLLPSILKENVNYLNLLILTHPDEDHDRWAFKIIDTIPVGGVAFPENFSKEYEKIKELAKKKKIEIFLLKKGKYFKTKNLNFEVLSPEERYYKNENEASLVLQISSNEKNFLIMADASANIGEEILRYLNEKIFYLSVGHHGGKGSVSYKFLNCLKPKVAIISVGRRNPYSHPSIETIEILKEKRILILRTDERGNIKYQFK